LNYQSSNHIHVAKRRVVNRCFPFHFKWLVITPAKK
jgi:hypothetical protein